MDAICLSHICQRHELHVDLNPALVTQQRHKHRVQCAPGVGGRARQGTQRTRLGVQCTNDGSPQMPVTRTGEPRWWLWRQASTSPAEYRRDEECQVSILSSSSKFKFHYSESVARMTGSTYIHNATFVYMRWRGCVSHEMVARFRDTVLGCGRVVQTWGGAVT
jgi:hypothetical protein